MRTFLVGGAVRDQLLGRAPAGDRDWVVVGATADEMLAQGYQQVGRDFPVFLHPQTHEEYALARTERKSAPGYRGFVVHAALDVTLEQDLRRRDLTINAMAMDEQGTLIDPCGGERDLRDRVLRHVGPAFVEDPVRILRLARFAARFAQFTVAPETMALARAMVDGGEADALVAERVWQELSRGLMEATPSRMLQVLADCGLLARRFPELGRLEEVMSALDRAAGTSPSIGAYWFEAGHTLSVRYAILTSGAPDAAAHERLLQRIRADQDATRMAALLFALRQPIHDAATAPALLAVVERADGIRRPAPAWLLVAAWEMLERERAPYVRAALNAVKSVDAGAVAARFAGDPSRIATALAQARIAAIDQRLAWA